MFTEEESDLQVQNYRKTVEKLGFSGWVALFLLDIVVVVDISLGSFGPGPGQTLTHASAAVKKVSIELMKSQFSLRNLSCFSHVHPFS